MSNIAESVVTCDTQARSEAPVEGPTIQERRPQHAVSNADLSALARNIARSLGISSDQVTASVVSKDEVSVEEESGRCVTIGSFGGISCMAQLTGPASTTNLERSPIECDKVSAESSQSTNDETVAEATSETDSDKLEYAVSPNGHEERSKQTLIHRLDGW